MNSPYFNKKHLQGFRNLEGVRYAKYVLAKYLYLNYSNL